MMENPLLILLQRRVWPEIMFSVLQRIKVETFGLVQIAEYQNMMENPFQISQQLRDSQVTLSVAS